MKNQHSKISWQYPFKVLTFDQMSNSVYNMYVHIRTIYVYNAILEDNLMFDCICPEFLTFSAILAIFKYCFNT